MSKMMNMAEKLITKLRQSEKYYAGAYLAEEFLKLYPKSNTLRDEYAFCCFYINKNQKGLELLNEIEEDRHGSVELMERVLYNKKLFLRFFEDDPITFTSSMVSNDMENPMRMKIHSVTFSTTTCRRLDLFVKSMDAFLENCVDKYLISRWICVDDNSSEEDRKIMKEKYPFFEFVWKDDTNKGHPESLQIITSMIDTPYLIHIEDDRMLVDKRRYISDMVDVLDSSDNIGQIAFNHNYSETLNDNIKGGILKKTPNNVFYYEHEYCLTEDDKKQFIEKHGFTSNCNYYPHFTLSPSMIKTKIFKQLEFIKERWFEFNFGLRYVQAGYVTTFLPGYHIKHIGRLTSQMNDMNILNAYDLLDTEQFREKIKYKSFMINLDRRSDRLEKINKQIQDNKLPTDIIRISAIDGLKLKINPRLRSLCRKNNFQMRPGVIGCALSHIQLYQKLLEDTEVDGYVIFEDDVISNNSFPMQMRRTFTIAESRPTPDVLFLTTIEDEKDNIIPVFPDALFLTTTIRATSEERSNMKNELQNDVGRAAPMLFKKESRSEIERISIGGTGCYYISKKGAQTVIDFIEQNTLDEAIDAILFKQSPFINMYFVLPILIYLEPFVDTDIQNDFHIRSHLLEDNIDESDYSPYVMYGENGKLDLFENLEYIN
ncbi:MAG: glycosyltransferase family 25 protein [Cetobacterium sp.]